MRINMISTEIMTEIDGVPVRLWEGTTDQGVRCKVFVHRLAVHEEVNSTEFDNDLKKFDAPASLRVVPLHAII